MRLHSCRQCKICKDRYGLRFYHNHHHHKLHDHRKVSLTDHVEVVMRHLPSICQTKSGHAPTTLAYRSLLYSRTLTHTHAPSDLKTFVLQYLVLNPTDYRQQLEQSELPQELEEMPKNLSQKKQVINVTFD